MKFAKPYLYNALEGMNFQSFTDIQKKIIPAALKGRDVIGVSETGSGKTHAFLLPIFDRIVETDKRVQSIIVSPTRELADQLYRFAKEVSEYTSVPIDIRLYTGGRDRAKEIERLKKSQPQIVIGTPGKLVDLGVKENVLKLYTARQFVIDEADMSLEIGFLNELEVLVNTVKHDAQLMVFSATFPDFLKHFVKKSMRGPYEAILSKKRLASLNIRHRFIKTDKDRVRTLERVLDVINPYLALIFANRIEDVEAIASHLKTRDLDVTKLHGDLAPRERKQVIRDIEKLNVQYIVASDMASRGIDIEGISHIINVAFPEDMTFYIHRVGRSGRMGQSGEAITLYTSDDDDKFDFLKKEEIPLDFSHIENGELISDTSSGKSRRKPPRGERVKPGYKKKHHAKKRKRGSS